MKEEEKEEAIQEICNIIRNHQNNISDKLSFNETEEELKKVREEIETVLRGIELKEMELKYKKGK